jgi:hypothetical protein
MTGDNIDLMTLKAFLERYDKLLESMEALRFELARFKMPSEAIYMSQKAYEILLGKATNTGEYD